MGLKRTDEFRQDAVRIALTIFHVSRQINSALMVLKNVSTAALS